MPKPNKKRNKAVNKNGSFKGGRSNPKNDFADRLKVGDRDVTSTTTNASLALLQNQIKRDPEAYESSSFASMPTGRPHSSCSSSALD